LIYFLSYKEKTPVPLNLTSAPRAIDIDTFVKSCKGSEILSYLPAYSKPASFMDIGRRPDTHGSKANVSKATITEFQHFPTLFPEMQRPKDTKHCVIGEGIPWL
jgi:hypothetical protein